MNPLLTRLPKGADLLEAVTALCKEHGITRGWIQAFGALEQAVLGSYLQHERHYVTLCVDEPVEVLNGVGSVSLKDGEPFVHLHLSLSRMDGSGIGGHAMAGNRVFVVEVLILPLEGPPLERQFDPETGLQLWSAP